MSYLTKAVLCRSARSGVLAPLLYSRDESRWLDSEHRLLWSLFPGPEQQRDFLWRKTRRGEFLVLSQRQPVGNEVFDRLITKPFEPALKQGDLLKFELRANATTVVDADFGDRGSHRRRGTRLDIIDGAVVRRRRSGKRESDALREREAIREAKSHEVRRWMERQGSGNGFTVNDVVVDGYCKHSLVRPQGKSVCLGVLDLSGVLTVESPEAVLTGIDRGFGRARAFGCGLMLIYRIARPDVE